MDEASSMELETMHQLCEATWWPHTLTHKETEQQIKKAGREEAVPKWHCSINHGDQSGLEATQEIQEENAGKDTTGFKPNSTDWNSERSNLSILLKFSQKFPSISIKSMFSSHPHFLN